MPLRIVLLNAHNTLNYGTMMMCENVITHMGGDGDELEYVVLADELEETSRRLAAATGRDDLVTRPRLAGFLSRRIFPRAVCRMVDQFLLRYVNLQRALGKCDAVVVLGGDDLSEYYGKLRVIDIFLRMASMKMAGRRVFLLGQTIGPFTGIRRTLARRVLDGMDGVYHRGPKSLDYARTELRCRSDQRVAGDLAFLPLARENEGDTITERGLRKGRYMVLVPSGLGSEYHDTSDAYLDGLEMIARHMLDLDPAADFKVVLLAHVLRYSDDRPLVGRLAERLSSDRVIAVADELLPFQARAILGGARMNVSQRMHGAISSLQQGVPVVALSYSVKYADVLGAYLKLPELVVEADRSGFLPTAQRTCERIDEVWKDLDAYRDRVNRAMADAEADVRKLLDELYTKITKTR